MTVSAEIHYGDCIRGMAEHLPDESVHLTVTSIPFEELFTYSGKPEDVGNNGSTIDIRAGRFALNMRFVVEQLFRATATGCNVCIHIQQLLAYKIQHGFMGRRDFRGSMIDVFGAGDFHFAGEFAIAKNPQAMAQRLNLHSLQFKTGYARDGNNLAPAPNDYVLIFHKPGDALTPVRPLKHKSKNPRGWLSTEEWVRDAGGIWTDIDEFDILDGARYAKESDQEKHVCPLQLEVIRRLVKLYSNPATVQSDVCVLDPFMGIGSTAWVAVEQGRNVVGFELKESYHAIAVKNVAKARKRFESRVEEPALF
jgi:DNA modification methylase